MIEKDKQKTNFLLHQQGGHPINIMANTLIVKGYTRQNTLTKVGNKTEISAKFARTQRAEKQMNGDLLYKKRRKRRQEREGRGKLTSDPTLYPPVSLSLFACGQVEVGNGHKQLELELKAWIVWIVDVVVVFGSPSCWSIVVNWPKLDGSPQQHSSVMANWRRQQQLGAIIGSLSRWKFNSEKLSHKILIILFTLFYFCCCLGNFWCHMRVESEYPNRGAWMCVGKSCVNKVGRLNTSWDHCVKWSRLISSSVFFS